MCPLSAQPQAWQFQEPVEESQAPPVLNTWYTALDKKHGVRIRRLTAFQENTETDAKDIELRVTIDGVEHTKALSAASGTANYFSFNEDGDLTLDTERGTCGFANTNAGGGTTLYGPMGFLEAHSIKVEYRLTAAAGTAQTLTCRLEYDLLRGVS